VALFVAATTPILVATWAAVWRALSAARGWSFGAARPRALFAATTAAALAAITAATGLVVTGHLRAQDQVTRDEFPVGAADWLRAHPGTGTRMFNQYGYGGYLAYRLYPDPDRRVFIFGEAELMGDGLLNQYQEVASLRPGWQRVLADRGVDYVVFNRGEALPNVLATDPDQWELGYQDATSVIYVRRR